MHACYCACVTMVEMYLQVIQGLEALEKDLIRQSRVSSGNQIYLLIVTQLLRATYDSIDRNSALEIT